MRLVIGGGPRTGKTTLARKLWSGPGLRHTDDLISVHPWSDASAEVAAWMHKPDPWVIEGVAAVRALRKFMAATPGYKAPCDKLIWLRSPRVPLSAGQARMAKGCETVLKQIVDELQLRGVEIEYR